MAHNSAGPKFDIIQENTIKPKGFLALTKEDYVNNLKTCLNPNREAFLK